MAFRGVDRGQLLSTRRMKAPHTRSGGLEGAASTDQSHLAWTECMLHTQETNKHTDIHLYSNMLKRSYLQLYQWGLEVGTVVLQAYVTLTHTFDATQFLSFYC